MDSQRWQTIKQILEKAIDLNPEERSSYLADVCGEDAELLREAEALLEYSDPDADVLEMPAFSGITGQTGGSLIGEKIGSYKVVAELGAGGMGSVYLASRVDGAFKQDVALKLIKRGMDSDAILKRFYTERQILASLQHPNIAHLIDGGTTEHGLPFFVMEYVDGLSIMDYAEREDLDLSERLKMFTEVCGAVTFAHQNLIIHRDLKPSNILVTDSGSPKLLDFGIAKLLRPEASGAETATQNFIFTPEYASPEQVRGEKLTTASDIYSLGVILYELLTGSRPHKADGGNISEIIRAVCDSEPERPSSVVSRASTGPKDTIENERKTTRHHPQLLKPNALRGDLDNLILKALRKEPERRYSSVEQLKDDILNHLAGLPVTASADTWSYRSIKFIRRNRIGVAASALILITILVGIGATLYQAKKAEARFNDVRQLANSFLFEFHDAIEDLPGSTPARELVVKRAVEYLDKLAAESVNDPTIQRELATAYEKVGRIQGNSYYSNLGDTDGATKSYNRSLEIRQLLADANPKDLALQQELANSYEGVGDMLYTGNNLVAGLASYEKAVAIREAVLAAEPANLNNRFDLATVLGKRGDIKGMEGFPNLGDTPGALESYKRAVSHCDLLLEAEPTNTKFRSGFASLLSFSAMLQTVTGDTKGAIESGKRAVDITESLLAADPNSTKLETQLMSSLVVLRFPLLDEGRTAEAVENARRVIQTMEKLSAVDPKNVQNRRNLSVSYNSLGMCLLKANDPGGAVDSHRRSLAIITEISGSDPASNENARDVVITKQYLAEALFAAGDSKTALAMLRQSIPFYEGAIAADNPDIQTLDDYGLALGNIGKILAATGDLAGAAESFRRALPFAEEVMKKAPHSVRFRTRHALIFFEAGKVFARLSTTEKGEKSEAAKSDSCDFLRRSFGILDALRSSGSLSPIYAGQPEQVAKELSFCNS